LIGCTSGGLTLQRSYAPIGTPLSYLMADSPIIVGNLWVMLESKLNLLAKSLCEDLLELIDQNNGKRIGAFVTQAREKCVRKFISGASMVCYGLPVGIHKNEEENPKSERQETC
jgi:separase